MKRGARGRRNAAKRRAKSLETFTRSESYRWRNLRTQGENGKVVTYRFDPRTGELL